MDEQTVDNRRLLPSITPEIETDFVVLMSLCLDDLLDDADQQRFTNYLAYYPALAVQWQEWQRLHCWFERAPHVEAPANLVANVTRTLLQQDRRRRLWQGLLFGALVMLLWGGLALVTIWLGALLLLSDGNWFSGLIHNIAFFSSTLNQWWRSAANLVASVSESPQVIGATLVYFVLAVVMLSFWIRFLHRSTRIESYTEGVRVSA